MPKRAAAMLSALPGASESAGDRVNHVCLALSQADFAALRARLEAAGVVVPFTMKDSFGAQGQAPEAFYFADPDGNVLGARYYAPGRGEAPSR